MILQSLLRWLPLATATSSQSPIASLRRADDNIPDQDSWSDLAKSQDRTLCYLVPDSDGGDDGPAIQRALTEDCKSRSLVVFPGPTYHINTPMTTKDLDDVAIHFYGKFLWSTDIDYWLSVSMPIGFQNQSTVWFFGGEKVEWDGHGVGTLDGNGQVWYDWAQSQGNLANRPMMINYQYLTNSVVKQMRYVQSQMWTMTVSYSKNVELADIYVNNTSTSEWSTLNTDGADTLRSDNITFRRWSVTNGDDSIALKGNSSNIYVYDSEFWDGAGLAVGSMGQYDGEYEHIEGFFVKNVTMHNTAHGCYLKTWSGNSNGYPPNGGGGGLGYARNIVMEGLVLDGTRSEPFHCWQCENYSGHAGEDCDSSQFHMSDIVWKDISGTASSDVQDAGWFQCSAAAGGCTNFTIENFSVAREGEDDVMTSWYCDGLHEHKGFDCNSDS